MGPTPLLLIFALMIGVENAIIAHCFSRTSPVASQTYYGLCGLIVGACFYVVRKPLGLDVVNPPTSILPAVILASLTFAVATIAASLFWSGDVDPAAKLSPRQTLVWILLAGLAFGVGGIAYLQSFVRGATPQLAVTTLCIGAPISTALIMSVLDRKPPTVNTLGSIVLVVAAVILLRRDLPSEAQAPEPGTTPPAAISTQ